MTKMIFREKIGMTRRRLTGVMNPRASEVTVFLPPKNTKFKGPGPSAVQDDRGIPAERVYETCHSHSYSKKSPACAEFFFEI